MKQKSWDINLIGLICLPVTKVCFQSTEWLQEQEYNGRVLVTETPVEERLRVVASLLYLASELSASHIARWPRDFQGLICHIPFSTA